jgi:hypothetical protein
MPRPRYVVRSSPIHGQGVFANVDLPGGVVLMEYRGARIPRAEARRRDAELTASGHTFLFDINDDWVIDGSVGGNAARFVNHGCDPNLEPLIHVDVDGDERRDKVLFHTLRPIAAGEELTFDYGIVLAVPHTAALKRRWACRCGSPRCRGTMLAERPRPRR